jgi:hypothetical protein
VKTLQSIWLAVPAKTLCANRLRRHNHDTSVAKGQAHYTSNPGAAGAEQAAPGLPRRGVAAPRNDDCREASPRLHHGEVDRRGDRRYDETSDFRDEAEVQFNKTVQNLV